MKTTIIPRQGRRSNKQVIIELHKQMQETEGKPYALDYIRKKLRRENGKWILESARFRYEVTDEPESGAQGEQVGKQHKVIK